MLDVIPHWKTADNHVSISNRFNLVHDDGDDDSVEHHDNGDDDNVEDYLVHDDGDDDNVEHHDDSDDDNVENHLVHIVRVNDGVEAGVEVIQEVHHLNSVYVG